MIFLIKNQKIEFNNNGSQDIDTRVRVANLSFDLDGQDDEIKKFFADCGPINKVEMIQRHNGTFAGVAIVEFADTASAAKALELNNQDLYGRAVNLSYEKKSSGNARRPLSEKPKGCTTIFIANLNFQVSEEEVIEFFSDCGTVKECRWPQGDFTGIGWIEFINESSVDNAVLKSGQELKGRQIRIDYAAPRRRNI